jgi:hypothetical protein
MGPTSCSRGEEERRNDALSDIRCRARYGRLLLLLLFTFSTFAWRSCPARQGETLRLALEGRARVGRASGSSAAGRGSCARVVSEGGARVQSRPAPPVTFTRVMRVCFLFPFFFLSPLCMQPTVQATDPLKFTHYAFCVCLHCAHQCSCQSKSRLEHACDVESCR